MLSRFDCVMLVRGVDGNTAVRTSRIKLGTRPWLVQPIDQEFPNVLGCWCQNKQT